MTLPNHGQLLRSAAMAFFLLVLGVAGTASAGHLEELVCTTGPGMSFDRGYDGSVTVFFRPGHYPASYGAPAPGECAFAHRGFRSGDGHTLVLGTHGPFSRYDADHFAHQLQMGAQFTVLAYNRHGQQHITHLNGHAPAPPPVVHHYPPPPPVVHHYPPPQVVHHYVEDDEDDGYDDEAGSVFAGNLFGSFLGTLVAHEIDEDEY